MRRWLAVVAIGAVLAAGCTSESSSADPSDAGTASPTTDTEAPSTDTESAATTDDTATSSSTSTSTSSTTDSPATSSTTTTSPPRPHDCTQVDSPECDDLRHLAGVTLSVLTASQNEEYLDCTVEVLIQSELADMFWAADADELVFFDSEGYPLNPALWLSGNRNLMGECPDSSIPCEGADIVLGIGTTDDVEITICFDDSLALHYYSVDLADETVTKLPACELTPVIWRAEAPNGEQYVVDLSGLSPPSLVTTDAQGSTVSEVPVTRVYLDPGYGAPECEAT